MTRCGRRCCGRSSGMSYHCFGSLRAPFEEYQRVTDFISEKQNADGVYGNEKTAKAVLVLILLFGVELCPTALRLLSLGGGTPISMVARVVDDGSPMPVVKA